MKWISTSALLITLFTSVQEVKATGYETLAITANNETYTDTSSSPYTYFFPVLASLAGASGNDTACASASVYPDTVSKIVPTSTSSDGMLWFTITPTHNNIDIGSNTIVIKAEYGETAPSSYPIGLDTGDGRTYYTANNDYYLNYGSTDKAAAVVGIRLEDVATPTVTKGLCQNLVDAETANADCQTAAGSTYASRTIYIGIIDSSSIGSALKDTTTAEYAKIKIALINCPHFTCPGAGCNSATAPAPSVIYTATPMDGKVKVSVQGNAPSGASPTFQALVVADSTTS